MKHGAGEQSWRVSIKSRLGGRLGRRGKLSEAEAVELTAFGVQRDRQMRGERRKKIGQVFGVWLCLLLADCAQT